ncbi:hypothetical protein BOX15_Mlig023375g2 [Macrostomum lignano]|uniref:Oxysterol-binding protein n=1 Tax=Macrostomum lignano TaxID=282301 RepID=A0A267EBY2_9PLAT|nr:hypothetical protein BOX15_Mlig023375g2 [Macrostomum lignano]
MDAGLHSEAWNQPLLARSRLPVEMRPREDFSVWEFLKNCVGKELTRIAMPVHFNEPLSFLQRVCEYLEYSHLLFEAERCDDPVQRLELITAFAVSGASSNWARLGKPFNPLQGETFELDRSQDRCFRAVCEQVSHHPPTSAFHAEATDGSWIFHGAVTPKLSFLGKSVEINPRGTVTLEFPKRLEVYTWQNVLCKIHNIIVGKLWVEHYGELSIRCHGNGYRSELKWNSHSLIGTDQRHKLHGYIVDPAGKKVKAMYGKWMDALYSLPMDTWKRHKKGGSGRKRISELSIGAVGSGDGRPRWKSFSVELPMQQEQSTNSEPTSSTAGPDNCEDREGDEESGASTLADLSIPGQALLWRRAPRPADSRRYFSFTRFTLALNDNSDAELLARLPGTDTRRRPDVRALELGDLALAQAEKSRLEEKQRQALRRNSSGGVWFRPGGTATPDGRPTGCLRETTGPGTGPGAPTSTETRQPVSATDRNNSCRFLAIKLNKEIALS